jgi:hypothetical protein
LIPGDLSFRTSSVIVVLLKQRFVVYTQRFVDIVER